MTTRPPHQIEPDLVHLWSTVSPYCTFLWEYPYHAEATLVASDLSYSDHLWSSLPHVYGFGFPLPPVTLLFWQGITTLWGPLSISRVVRHLCVCPPPCPSPPPLSLSPYHHHCHCARQIWISAPLCRWLASSPSSSHPHPLPMFLFFVLCKVGTFCHFVPSDFTLFPTSSNHKLDHHLHPIHPIFALSDQINISSPSPHHHPSQILFMPSSIHRAPIGGRRTAFNGADEYANRRTHRRGAIIWGFGFEFVVWFVWGRKAISARDVPTQKGRGICCWWAAKRWREWQGAANTNPGRDLAKKWICWWEPVEAEAMSNRLEAVGFRISVCGSKPWPNP